MRVGRGSVSGVGEQPENERETTWTQFAPGEVVTMSVLYREVACCPFIESFHDSPLIGRRSTSHITYRFECAL